jgi:hypothetical protein
MIFLISPAKKLENTGWKTSIAVSQPRFLGESEYLLEKLRKKSARGLSKMMSISSDLADLNVERFQNWNPVHNQENSTQAMLLFQGDVYQGLGAADFKKKEAAFAQAHLRILSGLYGVLRPLDATMPYRLEMGSDFKVTAAKKNLYAYWADTLQKSIMADAAELDTDIVVNLASNEYSKAAKLNKTGLRVIEIDFKDFHKGEYKMISFFAKKARGLMARYAIKNLINEVEDLKGFDLDGYHFNARFSKGDKWVFTREQ